MRWLRSGQKPGAAGQVGQASGAEIADNSPRFAKDAVEANQGLVDLPKEVSANKRAKLAQVAIDRVAHRLNTAPKRIDYICATGTKLPNHG